MEIRGYAFREPNAPLEPFVREERIESPDQVIVRVAGCGLCHTDITFYTGEVAPRHELPLVLGHEISGVVEETGELHRHLLGRPVLVPAVMPCGECDRCRAGLPNTCRASPATCACQGAISCLSPPISAPSSSPT
jgi:6-hydroxycyclohex-1-ene-1-carbonyl-CoA dehydrogenase